VLNALIVPLIQVISVAAEASPGLLTLPGTMAALMRDEIASFPALRPHQRHAWHSFLVLLAVNALHRSGMTKPPETEAAWAILLRCLTPDHTDDAAWCLVSPPDRPALLQPPIPDGLAALESIYTTPDQLDMLATAKNHDLKQARMVIARPDDWLFALLTLQTMEGYSGRTRYGISRMNGGVANRAAVSLAPPGGPGAHVRRDVLRLLALRAQRGPIPGYAADRGLALVWLAPWDGTTALRQNVLDAWYIEICRRARLILCDGIVAARTSGSKVARIVSVEGGDTGDPWSPVVVEKDGKTKALTVNGRGFTYRRMVDLIWHGAGIQPSPLQEIASTDPPDGLELIARALVRGQGKTEGYHERRVLVSKRVRRGLSSLATDSAAEMATQRVKLAGEMQGVLKSALLSLFQNGPDKIKYDDKESDRKAATFLARFDSEVDVTFFPDLWREFEQDGPEAQRRERALWVNTLLAEASAILRGAETAAARSSSRRWRASVRATDRLYGAARSNQHLRPYLEEARS
jgi:CRISPR system Cascade subunit CasA